MISQKERQRVNVIENVAGRRLSVALCERCHGLVHDDLECVARRNGWTDEPFSAGTSRPL
jgi:hypothetical protein